MKKDVIIVEPRSNTNVFSFFDYLPLMGPLYLGTKLKQEGYNVKFLNENILKRSLNARDLDADYLLLSCLTPTVTRGYELADDYRRIRPDGKVLIGGPHVTFMKEEAAEHADYVAIGEGDEIIVDLIKYGYGDKFVPGRPVKDMDSLPFIDWSITEGLGKMGIRPIMTSRGCPFACNFCSVTAMYGRKFRAMSAERVFEEIDRVDEKDIFFYDDNFTADKKRAHDIMDLLIKSGKKKSWTAQVRSDVVNDVDLVEKMAASGCCRVYIGFESINPATLKTLKKSQTPSEVKNAVATLHKHKIKVHGMFMYGSDSDNPAIVKETVDFVKKSKIDTVQYMILTPLPGTPLFQKLESEDRLIHRNWKYYDAMHVVFWPQEFSPFDLQRLSIESFKSFYSLTSATNELLNFTADRMLDTFSWVKNRSKKHTFSLKNVLLKAGGKLIVNKWQKVNRSYMDYLYQLKGTK